MKLLILIVLNACVSPVESVSTSDLTAPPDVPTICIRQLCDWDFQCDDACTGPAYCAPVQCDNCPGVCQLLSGDP